MKLKVMIIATVFLSLYMLLASQAYANKEKKEEKIYTQTEFSKALEEGIAKGLKKMGRKEIVNLSRELLQKEKKIILNELEIEKENQTLSLTKKALNKQIVKFKERQSKLLACLDDVDKKRRKRVQHMVDVISGMRPQTAAEVLSVQDAEISVQILGMLEPAKVSKIFNKMEKEISARLQKQYMNMKK